MLAMARAYAKARLRVCGRNAAFPLWNAGEEKGLWGSQYQRVPPIDLAKIVADLNMDMIEGTRPGFTDPDPTHVL
jgi:hypothetical protein